MIPIVVKSITPASRQCEPPLEKLADSKTLTDNEKLAKLSKSFEALLLRNVLENAQKPMFTSKLVNDSATGSIYRDMVTTQLADSIAQSGTFGLASLLERQMRRPEAANSALAPQPSDDPIPPTDAPKRPVLRSPKESA